MNELYDFGPLWMASSPLTSRFAPIKKAIDNGADCIVTKSVTSRKTNEKGKRTLLKRKMMYFDGDTSPIPAYDRFSWKDKDISDSLFCTSTNRDIELLSIKQANDLYDRVKKYSPDTKFVQNFVPRNIYDFDNAEKLKADAIEISPRGFHINLRRPYTLAVHYNGEFASTKDNLPISVRRECEKAERYRKEIKRIDSELKEGLENINVGVPVLFKCERDIFRTDEQLKSFPVDGFTYANTKKCDFFDPV